MRNIDTRFTSVSTRAVGSAAWPVALETPTIRGAVSWLAWWHPFPL